MRYLMLVLAVAAFAFTALRDTSTTVSAGAPVAVSRLTAERKILPAARELMRSPGSRRYLVTLGSDLAPTSQPTPEAIRAMRRDVLRGLPARAVLRTYDALPIVALNLSREAVHALAARPGVRTIEPDVRMRASDTESLPLVNGTAAQAYGYRGVGTQVAVIDTGVDTDHPDLADDLVGQACFVTNNGCPNGSSTQTGTGAAEAFAGQSHGTHVAGIVSSKGTVAPIGLAPDADIIAINVFGASSGAYSSDIIAGINHVVSNYPGTDAINMSLGASAYTSACDSSFPSYASAINAATNAGIAVVVASGNSGDKTGIASPACITNAIAVGAVYDANVGSLGWSGCTDSTTAANKVTCFSQSSPQVDLLAPGALITSSVLDGQAGVKGGTSMAAPHVAAAVALLRGAYPGLTVSGILSRLQSRGWATTDPANGRVTKRIDVLRALDVTVPTATIDIGALTATRSVTVVAGGSDNLGVTGYYVSENATAPALGAAGWSANGTFAFTLSDGEGLKTVYAWAKDRAGNLSTAAVGTARYDFSDPTLTVTAPSYTNTLTPSITVTANDASGIEAYAVVMGDGGPPALGDAAWQSTPPTTLQLTGPDGQEQYYVYVLDGAHHLAYSFGQITLDRDRPVATISTPSLSRTRAVTVSLTTTEAATTGGWWLSESSTAPSASSAGWLVTQPTSFTLTSAGDGTKTIYAWTKDRAGNVSAVVNATLALDTTAPVVTATGPANVKTTTVPLTISATGSPTAYYVSTTATAPGVNVAGWTATPPTSFTLPSGDGLKTVYVWARDLAGNRSATKSVAVRLDTTLPTSTITSPANLSAVTTFSSLAGTATDTGSGVQKVVVSIRRSYGGACTWFSGGVWVSDTCSAPKWLTTTGTTAWSKAITATSLSGTYTITSVAYDNAGNVQATPTQVTVTIP